MTKQHYILLNKEEFNTKFTTLPNVFSDYAGLDGACFETTGEELAYIRSHNKACVWTKIIGHDKNIWLISGYHEIWAIGYVLTEEPVPNDTYIKVRFG